MGSYSLIRFSMLSRQLKFSYFEMLCEKTNDVLLKKNVGNLCMQKLIALEINVLILQKVV